MGLLKAGMGAAGGVMADQWKEYIYCESMPADVLACKGCKRTGDRSSNVHGEDNVISNGSVIAVNDGKIVVVPDIALAVERGHIEFFAIRQTSAQYFLGEKQVDAGLRFLNGNKGSLDSGLSLQIIIVRHGHRGKDAEDDQNRNDFNKSKARSALRCRHADSPHKRVRRRV